MPAQDPTTVKLLTLLNVSSLKSKRRSLKSNDSSPGGQSELETPKRRKLGGKLAKKAEAPTGEDLDEELESEAESEVESHEDESSVIANDDPYVSHFGSSQESGPSILTSASRSAIDTRKLIAQRLTLGTGPDELGAVVLSHPEGVELGQPPKDFPSLLSGYRDVMLPYVGTSSAEHDKVRRHVCDHAVHRKRIMVNNARLLAHSKAAAAATEAAKSGSSKVSLPDPPSDVRDQGEPAHWHTFTVDQLKFLKGFTRPTVLILLPFRNSALAFVNTLISALETYHNVKPEADSPAKAENYARFLSEYGLPPGAEDKLLSAEPGTYPSDHVRNFAGNTDDAFRLGIRLSNKGKGWRLFSGFLNSDIIIASPLGLRMGIEREGPPDFLSSVEIMLIDQLDCLTMQNWAHLTHIIELSNVLPKEANGADFTPQTRALFNNTQLLKNVAGRVRQTRPYGPTPIPEGLAINWVKLDCEDPAKEPDTRFEYFKEKIVPDILSSAQAQTLVFVPSYFDYLRVYNHLVSHASTSVTGISEWVYLHITFYGPPDHAQFFTEILSFPFLDDDAAPIPTDVKVACLYSKSCSYVCLDNSSALIIDMTSVNYDCTHDWIWGSDLTSELLTNAGGRRLLERRPTATIE
ncbi:digestive organ expansion factor [Rhizoctonia solani AG-1 IA]|uniref:U3 small nucleolar RNA-associated protein 25 n=1 Tax=Thanatephorus cucumeris (strain AG1-IA) TaxID=983506 RepID=L8WG10_THACA|nr:digestive organ expansion factor [Rhizoctonia solani AG-1 IA]